MKTGWNLVQLGELTDPSSPITYGVIKPGEEGDVLFVRGGDISDGNIRINQLRTITKEISEQYSRTLLKGGELLMCLVGQPGQVAIAPHHLAGANIARQVGLIRLQSNLNAEFIKYFLQSPDGQQKLGAQTGGSVQQVINLSDLRTIEIPLPSAVEQQRIVAILDEAFEAISAARTNAEQNRQNARALFDSYLQSVFNQRDEGWLETTIDKISTNLDSKRIPITKSDRKAGKYPYYGASGIVDYVADYIFDGDSLLVSEDGANLLARSTPIAFSVSGKYWVNNHAHILKFEHMATQRFVEFYFASILLDEYITGAAQPKLNQKALNSIPIPIPVSIELQAEIVGRIESLHSETQRLESLYHRKITVLDELKQSLLQQAFSGQL